MNKWIDEYNIHGIPSRVGEVGFLVSRYDTNRGTHNDTLQDRPAYTNMSGEPKLDAWCGETNNVSVSANGLARIVRVNKNGRVRIEKLSDPTEIDAYLDNAGYPELIPDRED